MKYFAFSLLASLLLMGCETAANMRSRYQPGPASGPWTTELRMFDEAHPDHATAPFVESSQPRFFGIGAPYPGAPTESDRRMESFDDQVLY